MKRRRQGLICLGLLAVACAGPVARATPVDRAMPAQASPALSSDAQRLVQWVARSNDHGGLPFIVIDKRLAHLWLFDGDARLHGHTPVLLGLARGDHSVPGIGERPMAQIQAHERTTPAGRFVIEAGRNLAGEDIFWIDYDAAVSLHRVHATNARERRLQRLATPSPADNRISYGCINVPVAFFDERISPLLKAGHGVAYLLPETVPLHRLFHAVDATAGPR